MSSALCSGQNDYLDFETVNSYLKLLRASSSWAKLLGIRELQHSFNEIGDEGVDPPNHRTAGDSEDH
jgi:hypothetical protein